MSSLSDLEIGYLAGLIDGEGSINSVILSKGKYTQHRITLEIYNTNKEVVEWVRSKVGGSMHSTGNRSPRHKPCWKIGFSGASAHRVIAMVAPILIIKRQHAVLVERFVSTLGLRARKLGLSDDTVAARENIRNEIKMLNKRGPHEPVPETVRRAN